MEKLFGQSGLYVVMMLEDGVDVGIVGIESIGGRAKSNAAAG